MPDNVYVYVDGFNLYYGAIKGKPHKWLDLVRFCESLLPGDNILKVKYFTAMVSGLSDPQSPIRQQVYLNALQHHCGTRIEIIKGNFRTDPKSMPIAMTQDRFARPNAFTTQKIVVIKTEEKGSDVNLAVHLLNDAWYGRYDKALVISNDSDLIEPIRLVITERRKPVGVVNPKPNTDPMPDMKRAASFSRKVKSHHLAASQLPDPIPGTSLKKPVGW